MMALFFLLFAILLSLKNVKVKQNLGLQLRKKKQTVATACSKSKTDAVSGNVSYK